MEVFIIPSIFGASVKKVQLFSRKKPTHIRFLLLRLKDTTVDVRLHNILRFNLRLRIDKFLLFYFFYLFSKRP